MLERFPNYWDKGQVHFDRIVYLPIVDATVRLANLRSGQLDFIERVASSRHRGAQDRRAASSVARITELGYQGITINIGKSEQAQKNPLGRDARVREAFELAIDRDGINAGRVQRRGHAGQPVGRTGQPLLPEERAAAQARRGAGARRC